MIVGYSSNGEKAIPITAEQFFILPERRKPKLGSTRRKRQRINKRIAAEAEEIVNQMIFAALSGSIMETRK